MTGNAINIDSDRSTMPQQIGEMWAMWDADRFEWKDMIAEQREYVFATDTEDTEGEEDWNNSTHLPKLAQIRDNLHANYITALFPNDDWLQWEAYTKEDNVKNKKGVIEAYMANKTRNPRFRKEVDLLLQDYIDFGNAFATTDYEHITRLNKDLQKETIYSGPVIRRIHPFDIVFNPTVTDIEDSPVIVRSLLNMGDLDVRISQSLDQEYKDALQEAKDLRSQMMFLTTEESEKFKGMSMDGFGNFYEYLGSGKVELLKFMGNYYDESTGVTYTNAEIMVIDRLFVVSVRENPSWVGRPIYHAAWRKRPDNLWGMGPLENLVGMQYRIDHLENLKADALDMNIWPPLKIKGAVPQFDWGPRCEIHISDPDGDVTPMPPDASAMTLDNEISFQMQLMEEFAGSPKETMGFRTPGEKTAFEVQQLITAASRIFQQKITAFEIELLEPALNSMLEQARRNFDGKDQVLIMSDAADAKVWSTITVADLASNGIVKPVGARHFAETAQMMQNLQNILNGPMGEKLAPHLSGVQLAKTVEDLLGIERYSLFSPNIAVTENQQTQTQINNAKEEVIKNQATPNPGEGGEGEPQ
jgi:hypothetical protein